MPVPVIVILLIALGIIGIVSASEGCSRVAMFSGIGFCLIICWLTIAYANIDSIKKVTEYDLHTTVDGKSQYYRNVEGAIVDVTQATGRFFPNSNKINIISHDGSVRGINFLTCREILPPNGEKNE